MTRRLILYLGGSHLRAEKCIELAHKYPEAFVLISSETPRDDESMSDYIIERGVDRKKVFNDWEAWDTITNFTSTYKRIRKQFRPDVIYVVTDGFHMKRSMIIANAVYWLSGIRLVPSISSPVDRKENPEYLKQARIRTWVWRLTRILLYWESTRKRRWDAYKIGHPKTWNEIAIKWWPF